jgi:hypothetical protein
MTETQITFKSVQIAHNITLDTTRNLLVSALEGGINYWGCLLKYEFPPNTTREDFLEDGPRAVTDTLGHVWHIAYVLPTIKDGGIVILDKEENSHHTLTREKLLNGFDIMAQKYPTHFNNIVIENDDAETADVLLQCSLFGEIIYG